MTDDIKIDVAYEWECAEACLAARRELNVATSERDRAKKQMLDAEARYIAFKRDAIAAEKSLLEAVEAWVAAGKTRDIGTEDET